MSFDGLVTRAVVGELKKSLLGGRILKVYQPFESDILLIIRNQGKNEQLYISTSANFSRIHLTEERYPNPKQPPMFCMLLRKHIEGGIVKDIRQISLDRIVHIDLEARDELGDIRLKTLIVEIMGRHSNLILIDTNENKIIDSLKHLPPSLNSYRTVLPGAEYIPPPEQNKLNPLAIDKDTILMKVDFNQGKMHEQLVKHFAGLSPTISKEIVHRAGFANKETLPEAFLSVMDLIRKEQYTFEIVRSKRDMFSIIPLTHIEGERTAFSTVNEMLDRFYFGKAERDRIKQQAHDLEKFLINELNKNKRKLKKLEKTLEESENARQYQLYGELLTAYMHEIKRGMSVAELDNYYEPGTTVTIELDPKKTPSENAQRYFQKYNKAKSAVDIVKRQIEETLENIAYYELLLAQMEKADLEDIAEIREELEEQGILKRKQQKQKKKTEKPKIETYHSSEGIPILVGKNNKQNEYLTLKLANKNDTWLHAKDIPGSHVVIRSEQFGDATLNEAAMLAAYFSKAKQSSNVAVDYTKIRYVKKPNGAKPGFVTYTNQKTLYVTPEEDIVRKLKA